MKIKPNWGGKISTTLPPDQWIQRTLSQDPNPRIPFTHGPASPDTFPPMQPWEKIAWSMIAGLVFGIVAFGDLLGLPW